MTDGIVVRVGPITCVEPVLQIVAEVATKREAATNVQLCWFLGPQAIGFIHVLWFGKQTVLKENASFF